MDRRPREKLDAVVQGVVRTVERGGTLCPDQGEWYRPVPGTGSESCRDVRRPHSPKQVDRQVAKRRHHARPRTSAHLRAVFIKGDVSHPVHGVFDRPVTPNELGQALFVGLLGCEAGDGVAHLVPERLTFQVRRRPLDSHDLFNVRELEVSVQGRARLYDPLLDATMPLVDLNVRRGKKRLRPDL